VRIELRNLDLGDDRSGYEVGILNDPEMGRLDILGADVAVERQSIHQAVRGEIARPGNKVVFRQDAEVGSLEVMTAALVMCRVEDEEVSFEGRVHKRTPWVMKAINRLRTFECKIKRDLREEANAAVRGEGFLTITVISIILWAG
jgi:hypothetical protein